MKFLSEYEIMCLDCEEQWSPYNESIHCICENPAKDAWIVFIRDPGGKWVRTLADAIDMRYNPPDTYEN